MSTLKIATLGIWVAATIAACDMPTSTSCKENLQCVDSTAGGESGGKSSSTSSSGATSKGGNGGSSSGGSTAGASLGGSNSGGSSATSSSDACGNQCSGATPLCNAEMKSCVACLGNTDCTDSTKPLCHPALKSCVSCLGNDDCKDADKPVCNLSSNVCVGCLSGADCTSATASRCDAATSTCTACQTNDDCTQIPGKGVCDGGSGSCVQCTASNETPCGTNSCNPATKACTETPRGTVGKCNRCLADSECIGGNLAEPTARCVPMTFNGAARGNYCLQRRATSPCVAPYTVLVEVPSVNGAPGENYCGINQAATTCESVVDMIASKLCEGETDCGSGQGGLCKESVATGDLRCTIPCGSEDQCTSGKTCTSDIPYCH